MAVTTGNIVQEAVAELQQRFLHDDRCGLNQAQMKFVFQMDVDDMAGIQEIADYLAALPWTEIIKILWSEQKILLLRGA